MTFTLWHYAAMAAVGAGVGFFSGMLGIGGAVLAVPAMVLIFGFEQHAAQGTSLVIVMFTACAGTLQYWRGKHIHVLSALAFLAGSLVAVSFAARLAQRVPAETLRLGFAVFLALMAASIQPKTGLTSTSMLIGAVAIVSGLRLLLR